MAENVEAKHARPSSEEAADSNQGELFTASSTQTATNYTPKAKQEDLPETYTVVKGDTLRSIGAQYAVSPAYLQKINEIEDPNTLRIDQEIKLK